MTCLAYKKFDDVALSLHANVTGVTANCGAGQITGVTLQVYHPDDVPQGWNGTTAGVKRHDVPFSDDEKRNKYYLGPQKIFRLPTNVSQKTILRRVSEMMPDVAKTLKSSHHYSMWALSDRVAARVDEGFGVSDKIYPNANNTLVDNEIASELRRFRTRDFMRACLHSDKGSCVFTPIVENPNYPDSHAIMGMWWCPTDEHTIHAESGGLYATTLDVDAKKFPRLKGSVNDFVSKFFADL